MKKLLTLALMLLAPLGLAQTLIYAQSSLPVTLDSADAQDGNSLRVAYQVTEGLITFKPGSAELIPGLAERWEANQDSTAWTFYLRQGVEFHDGTPFNAEAVKFNFERWNSAERASGKSFVPWTWVFGGFQGEGSLLESVEVVDEHTVRFVLNRPVGFFPSMVAAGYFMIQSPQAVQAHPEDYGTPEVGIVGTGPFTFTSWVIGERVELAKNPKYWGEPAKLEGIVFRGIQEPASRLAELRAGTVHIAAELSPDDRKALESDSKLKAVVQEGINIGYLGLNQASGPLADAKVRAAIALAIDQNAIVAAFYQGLGVAADQFVPPAMWGRASSDQVALRKFDPEQAKKLLAEAGYPNGFSTEFWYMPVSRPYFPAPQPIAETIASYLSEIGIQVSLRSEDWGAYLSDYNQGKFPIYMMGWSPDYGDPDNYLYTFFGPEAKTSLGWNTPSGVEVRELLEQARTAPDQAEREKLYAEIQTIVYQETAAIPIAHNNPLNGTLAGVSGWVPSPLGSAEKLAEVTLE